MAVYDYGFVKSNRPLTASELAAARQKAGIGPTQEALQSYYRERAAGGAVAPATTPATEPATSGASTRRWEDWPWSSSAFYSSPTEEAVWKSWWESGGQPPPGAIPYTSKTAPFLGIITQRLRQAEEAARQAAPGGGWTMPEFPRFELPLPPAPPPPPKVETEPTVSPEIKPAEPPVEKLPAGVRRGQAGFEAVAAPVTAPSVEDLLAQYEAVFGPQTGRAREYVREYLGSPHFQRVMGGAVPMWMAADPLWRLYLHRLGLLRGAVERRLGTSSAAESAE